MIRYVSKISFTISLISMSGGSSGRLETISLIKKSHRSCSVQSLNLPRSKKEVNASMTSACRSDSWRTSRQAMERPKVLTRRMRSNSLPFAMISSPFSTNEAYMISRGRAISSLLFKTSFSKSGSLGFPRYSASMDALVR
eukprot:Skav226841  [mRNA]  locus=scaffold1741:227101:231252:+ [translate_table: standard]